MNVWYLLISDGHGGITVQVMNVDIIGVGDGA